MLTRARHARHMAWLAAHGPRQFSMRQWRQVFFTDESRFTLYKLWQHGAGRYPAGKLGDAVAQMELQPAGGFHPYILHLLRPGAARGGGGGARAVAPRCGSPFLQGGGGGGGVLLNWFQLLMTY
jgi:hypothetical protein